MIFILIEIFFSVRQHVLPNRVAGRQHVRHGGNVSKNIRSFLSRRDKISVEKIRHPIFLSRQGQYIIPDFLRYISCQIQYQIILIFLSILRPYGTSGGGDDLFFLPICCP